MEPDSRLKPIKEFRVSRRNLPHFELPSSIYFITFRTADRIILTDLAKDIVIQAFHFHDDKKYSLHACVVMNEHVHCILEPLKIPQKAQAGMPVPQGSKSTRYFSLSQITHSVKSYSAKQINQLSNKTGTIWQDENYDRVIRDEEEYSEKMNYLIYNPVKAEIVETSEDYKWLYVKS